MLEVITNRTPEIIAVEIRGLEAQGKAMLFHVVCEIGKRLAEVKAQLKHGEWGIWLKKNVGYSERTAQNYMLLVENSKEINAKPVSDLHYTKALALLTLPKEEREDFIVENDVENMSKRELREAIKAKKAAEKQLQEAENKYQELQEEHAHMKENVNQMIIEKLDLQNKNAMLEDDCSDYQNLWSQSKLDNESLLEEIKEQKNLITELTSQIVIAKNGNLDNGTVAELTEKLNYAHNEIKKLTAKLDTPIVVEKIVERTPDHILSQNLLKHYEAIEYNFSQLIDALAEVSDDPLKTKYTAAMKCWLSSAMKSMETNL